MGAQPPDQDGLLTPAEVAAILYVDPKTVTRWATAGKITAIRTPGGHRRYLRSEIVRLRHGASDGAALCPTGHGRAQAPAGDVAVVAGAVVDAADLAALAAATAREERAVAARLAAKGVARQAAETATAMQRRADVATRRLAEAAALAAELVAELVAEATAPGARREHALTALRVAVVVQDAAVASAAETAAAAASVATAVAAAAVDVALVVSAADLAIESEVARTARALQTVASSAARDAAADVLERAADLDRTDVVPTRNANGRSRDRSPSRRPVPPR